MPHHRSSSALALSRVRSKTTSPNLMLLLFSHLRQDEDDGEGRAMHRGNDPVRELIGEGEDRNPLPPSLLAQKGYLARHPGWQLILEGDHKPVVSQKSSNARCLRAYR